MSSVYFFDKIDNSKGFIYTCEYSPNSFLFQKAPYFTIISTIYSGGTYDDAYSPLLDGAVTKSEIANMWSQRNIKVDLTVTGKETANLILPLVSIDDDYVYFRDNDGLILKVDSNGAVTEVSTNPVD